MVSAENQKGSEELLPAPGIPGELNPEGLMQEKAFNLNAKLTKHLEMMCLAF